MVAAKQRIQAERDRMLSHAWHVAALSKQERLPDLRVFLASSTQQSPEQQRVVLHQLGAKLGLKVRKFRFTRKPAA